MAIANSLAFMLYLCCGVVLIRNFLQREPNASALLPVNLIIILALIFHGSDIIFSIYTENGWNLGLLPTLSISAWLMALIAFILGLRFTTAHPGLVIYPLVAISLVLKQSVPSEVDSILMSPALEWHVLLSLTAYSLLTLAALQAIILGIQEQQLRQHHIVGLIRKLPPLQSMESGLFQLLSAGFIFLSLGLFIGLLFIEDLFAQHLLHKTVLSLLAWTVFAMLLWGRRQYGWRSKIAVKWTLIGFSFLVLAYLGSKFILEFILAN
ncbi:MAG: phosphohydrolase [Gammaproteobacteria bacterium]|nr:MAG: phosphohydrolase [Gammaproteobacteria bacterium]